MLIIIELINFLQWNFQRFWKDFSKSSVEFFFFKYQFAFQIKNKDEKKYQFAFQIKNKDILIKRDLPKVTQNLILNTNVYPKFTQMQK